MSGTTSKAEPVKTRAPRTMEEIVAELSRNRARIEQGGGPQRIAKHHEQGKLTARERIAALVDPESFEELGQFARHRAEHLGLAGCWPGPPPRSP